MEKSHIEVEVVSQRAGAKPLKMELLESAPNALHLRFVPNDPNPHSVFLRLHTDHVLGRPLSLPKPPPQQTNGAKQAEDPFSDSEDESDKAKGGRKENGQGDGVGVGGGMGGGEAEAPILDDAAAVKAGFPLDFMPIVFRTTSAKTEAPAEAQESDALGGLGRGRSAIGQNQPDQVPGPPPTNGGSGGGFVAHKARVEENWDAESKPPATKPASASLRAGLSGFSPPSAKPSASAVPPVAAKFGDLKLGGPLPSKAANSKAPFARKEPFVLEKFKAPVEEAWDEELGKTSQPTKTGQPSPGKPTAASGGLGPEVRASWLAPKRVLTEFLDKDKPVLFGETQLVLGEAGKSEDREAHFNQPTAVAVNERNGDVIVADSQNRLVKIFKCSGTLRALIGNEDPRARLPFHDPSGVVIMTKEKVEDDLVAVKCENGIHIITYDAQGSPAAPPQIIRTIEANGPHNWLRHPMGLALTAQGHLLTISNAKSANAQTEVVVMEAETGSLVRRFPFRPSQETSGCAPRFLDVWADRLVVSDLGKNLVYVLSAADGTELFRFGGPGRQPGKFSFASGVAIDGAGNMIVGDAKGNRVQLFDPNGRFLQVVHFSRAPDMPAKQQVCPFPAGVHLTAHGHLAFTSRGPSGQIVVITQLQGRSQLH